MSTSSSFSQDSGDLHPGFNVDTGSQSQNPLQQFQQLKNWAPQALQNLGNKRKSNIQNQMVNPVTEDQPKASGVAKGLIGSILG